MRPHICRACGKELNDPCFSPNVCLGSDREEDEAAHMEAIKELRAETVNVEPEHKPCPFCGSTRIVKGERYFAMCVDCGATGPERISTNIAKSFKDWNTRV